MVAALPCGDNRTDARHRQLCLFTTAGAQDSPSGGDPNESARAAARAFHTAAWPWLRGGNRSATAWARAEAPLSVERAQGPKRPFYLVPREWPPTF